MGVKNLNQFPPIHRTKPVTWYLWVSSLWHIIPVSVVAFCPFCVLLWPHQIMGSFTVLKFMLASPLGITEILLQLVGQQTSRRSFPILSIITSFIIIYTFNLALSLPSIVVIYRPVPPTKYSRIELYSYSAFYHSPPLKCLLNSREKGTGSHHNILTC